MSSRFSQIDFEKQIKDLNEAKKIASLYPGQKDVSQSIQPSLIGNYLSKDDLNPGVYTQAYITRINELANCILIKIKGQKAGKSDDKVESQDSFASLTGDGAAKSNSEENAADGSNEREVIFQSKPIKKS